MPDVARASQADSPDNDLGRPREGAGTEEPKSPPATARADASTIVARAREQLAQLLGRPAEVVTRFQRRPDGWQVEIEVVELMRIPATTSLLATYQATLDNDGNVVGYERLGRYTRNQADLP